LAAGKEGPIPYKAIVTEWKEYVDPKYFPRGISFKDPSKYLTDESNSILKLWRTRRDRGEMYFRFKSILGSDKHPEETDYPEGIFENLQSPTVVDFVTRRSQVQDKDQSSDEDSDETQVIRNRMRIRSPEEGSEIGEPDTGAEVEEPDAGAEVGDDRIPARYRRWSPEDAEVSDEQGQDNDDQAGSLPDVEGDEEEEHVQNLSRGRRSQKARLISVDSDEGITASSPKTIPRAPQRHELSPTFDSSPTLAGSSPMAKRRSGMRSITRAAGRSLLTPESTVQSTDGSPEGRQLRPRRTATAGAAGTVSKDKATAGIPTKGTATKGKSTAGTKLVKVVAKKGTGKGKKS
jgi:hypothetical protein